MTFSLNFYFWSHNPGGGRGVPGFGKSPKKIFFFCCTPSLILHNQYFHNGAIFAIVLAPDSRDIQDWMLIFFISIGNNIENLDEEGEE